MEASNTQTPIDTNRFFGVATHPVKFRLFLLKNLPAAYFSGVRVRSVNSKEAIVTVPYKWFTRNPFRSTYFASLSMAAEMSTGVLAMGHVYGRQPKVSMLVVAIEGKFYKKAVSETRFVCSEGDAMKEAIEKAVSSGEPQTNRALSSGYNKAGELVAEFWVTWGFRKKGS